jgi:hypothetical protein
MNPGKIELVIDEIVVQGIEILDRDRFRAQVELALERMLEEEGGLPALAESTGLRVVAPVQTVTAAPAQIPCAAQVARAVHGSIMKTMGQSRQQVDGSAVAGNGSTGSVPPLEGRLL